MGWHCPQLLNMITRQPTPEEQKRLETETFVKKNETVDIIKLVAVDYIVNGLPNPTDTLNDVRERRDKAVAAFNAMAPQILVDLKQQPEPQLHYTRLGYAGTGRERKPKPPKPPAPARLGY